MNPVAMAIINPRKEKLDEPGIKHVTYYPKVLHAIDSSTGARMHGSTRPTLYKLTGEQRPRPGGSVVSVSDS